MGRHEVCLVPANLKSNCKRLHALRDRASAAWRAATAGPWGTAGTPLDSREVAASARAPQVGSHAFRNSFWNNLNLIDTVWKMISGREAIHCSNHKWRDASRPLERPVVHHNFRTPLELPTPAGLLAARRRIQFEHIVGPILAGHGTIPQARPGVGHGFWGDTVRPKPHQRSVRK